MSAAPCSFLIKRVRVRLAVFVFDERGLCVLRSGREIPSLVGLQSHLDLVASIMEFGDVIQQRTEDVEVGGPPGHAPSS